MFSACVLFFLISSYELKNKNERKKIEEVQVGGRYVVVIEPALVIPPQ